MTPATPATPEDRETIPEAVLIGLEEVRADGEFNMLAYNSIIRDMLDRADTGGGPIGMEEGEYRGAICWLLDNKDRYMEALEAMGARRAVLLRFDRKESI